MKIVKKVQQKLFYYFVKSTTLKKLQGWQGPENLFYKIGLITGFPFRGGHHRKF